MMYFFKRENFYIPGHYMKFLISKRTRFRFM